MKPVLLLDVDGVLNPEFTPRAWARRSGRDGWRRCGGAGSFVLYDRHAKRVRAGLEAPYVPESGSGEPDCTAQVTGVSRGDADPARD